MDSVLHYLRTLGTQGADGLDDSELLERFVARRDESAFAVLLQRHGPMVLGVCRRLLGQPADAEDAFQATFLVLVRHARTVRKRASVASWLYGVAYRTALKARARRTAWRRRQRQAPTMQPQEPADDLVWRDLRPLLDEEVARLPDKYRAPLLLCDVEGLTYEEAARRLGCTRGALSARLTRARELLRGRLTRRGVTLTAAVLGAALGQHARAAVPAALATAALRAVSLTVAGQAAGALPAEILSLTEEVGQAMKTRFALALGFLMAFGLAAGAAALWWPAPPTPPLPHPWGEGREGGAPEGPPPGAPPRQAGVDLHGDALPQGAVARFGSPRFRHAGDVHALSFSGDGKILASVGHDNAVRLWEAATGKEIDRVSGFKDAPEWATLSPDGKRLATASLPGGRLGGLRDVGLWDRATGKQIRGWVGGHSGRGALAFAPDGKFLAVISKGKLLLCEAGTGKEVRQIKCRDHVYPPVVFAGDGKNLAAPAVETEKEKPVATTRVWEVATGQERRRFASGSTLALSPDGKRLAVGAGGTILLHDTVTGKQTLRLSWPRPQPGPDGLPDGPPEAGVTSVAFSPDGKQLAAGGDGPVVRVWEVATGKPVHQFPAYEAFARDVAFSPDGTTLAATDSHGVRLWDPVTGKERLAAFGHWAPVEALVVSPDGKTVTSVDTEALLTWETATGRGLTRCAVSRGRSLATGLLLPVALAPGVRHFAVADADGTVRVRATDTGKEVRRFAIKAEPLQWLALSPDGKALATVGQAKVGVAGPQTVRFWDAATGAAGRRLPDMPPGPLAFSPDGKLLATADGTGTDQEGSVALWRVADGKRVRHLGAERLSIGSLAFSPDGKILATAGDRLVTEGEGVSVRLWDVASGQRLRAFLKTDPRFPRMEVLAFAPNGRTLATGGSDGVVRLWEAATGAERGHFKTGQGPIHSLAFTPDGTRLISGGQDSTALVWEISRALRPEPEAKDQ